MGPQEKKPFAEFFLQLLILILFFSSNLGYLRLMVVVHFSSGGSDVGSEGDAVFAATAVITAKDDDVSV